MQLINVDEKHDVSRTVTSWGWVRLGLSLCLLGLPVLLGCLGLQFADLRNPALQNESAQAWVQGLRDQKADLEWISQQTLIQLKALTRGLAGWHNSLARPNLLGPGLATGAGGDKAGFAIASTAWTGPGEGLQRHRLKYSDNWSFPDQAPYALAGNALWAALTLASSTSTPARLLHSPLQRHKHGRLIDPAAYLHATIR